MTRVVVTGMGVRSSIGSDIDSYWSSLKAGKSGITSVTTFDSTDIASKVASEITDFNPEDFMDPKEALVEMTAMPSLLWLPPTVH